MALPQESRGLLERAGAEILYTGVGKVNAAAALARRLAEMRCTGAGQPLVVNLGTAGSRTMPAHTLVTCNRFAQRDMDVSGMGLEPGVTPFDATPPVINGPKGEEVASDGTTIAAPADANPRLAGYFVCFGTDAIYVLETDPQ